MQGSGLAEIIGISQQMTHDPAEIVTNGGRDYFEFVVLDTFGQEIIVQRLDGDQSLVHENPMRKT